MTTGERRQACCHYVQEAESIRAVGIKEEDATTLNSSQPVEMMDLILTPQSSQVSADALQTCENIRDSEWEDCKITQQQTQQLARPFAALPLHLELNQRSAITN